MAGESDGVTGPTTDGVWSALHDVMDPELPISIVDMGLVYGVRVTGGRVALDLTFTATACPCIDFIETDIRHRLEREPGVEEIVIRRVWDPPWTKARINERGRAKLREVGVAL